MSEWKNIAARAAEQYEAEAMLGELRWSAGGRRCHERHDGDTLHLTVTCPDGPGLRYEIVGLPEGCLR
jgi:hypothetical protein